MSNHPSNVTIVHWAFDIMVSVAGVLLLIVLWWAIAYWRRREVPSADFPLVAAAGTGFLTYVAMEAGWIVTEVGRQPWIVYNILKSSDAVTGTATGGLWVSSRSC